MNWRKLFYWVIPERKSTNQDMQLAFDCIQALIQCIENNHKAMMDIDKCLTFLHVRLERIEMYGQMENKHQDTLH